MLGKSAPRLYEKSVAKLELEALFMTKCGLVPLAFAFAAAVVVAGCGSSPPKANGPAAPANAYKFELDRGPIRLTLTWSPAVTENAMFMFRATGWL